MAKRPRPTLFDYALIAINPTLIMLMVGSLMFFLVVVMYRGEFETRLSFILAMFVMAIVLITRISIEQGSQYASYFAIPLAIVVFLALGRFVTFPGALASFAMLINVGLMGLIWWSSHRITWDCTVIDESVEAPGEGLLQTAGFETGSHDVALSPAELSGTTVTAAQARDLENTASDDSTLTRVWKAYRQVSHRPHSHGMWVVYFALAALPIFGIGQGFIDSLGGRRYAFLLFCVYLLSSFALLMTTSLLGLRRYLRQRHLEMPAGMPAAWFGMGSLLILAILLLCLMLPRPFPEYSVSNLDWFATSPITLETNFWGSFEGKESPDGNARGDSEDAPPSDDGGQTGDRSSERSQGSQDQSGESQTGESPTGESPTGESQTGESPTGESQTGESPTGESQTGESPTGESQTGESQTGEGPTGESQTGESSSGQGQTDEGQAGEGQAGEGQGGGSQPGQQQAGREPSGQRPGSTREGTSAREDRTDPSSGQGDRRSTASSAGPSASSDPSTQQSSGGRATSSARSPTSLPTFSPSIASFLKFLYYLAVIVICGFLLWRFREQLAEGWRKLLDEFHKWRDRWGSAPEGVSQEETTVPPERRERPFSAFPNPFLQGGEARRTAAELVRYSFSALEAWGREHHVARRGEETPLEFAGRMGATHPDLARASRDVCLLYSQLAYGGGELPRETSDHLKHVWSVLERREAAIRQPVASLPE